MPKSKQESLLKPEKKNQGPVTCLGMTFENDEKRREYFIELLREKLKDPEFRKIEGFPIGEDEDILALSDPPYYTACPNPWLNDFIEQEGKTYDSTKPYNRKPFASDVSEGKNDPIYNAHAYHTKVSYLAIRRYINHFTEPSDLVLDFFSGTGMTGVAAQKCEGGERKCILTDISPVATHVAGAFTSPFSLNLIKKEAEHALAIVRSQYDWMYETRHYGWPAGERDPKKRVHQDHGRNNQNGTINFVVWSDVFLCPECGADINFWKTAVDFRKKRVLDDFKCPSCRVLLKKRGLSKAKTTIFDQALEQTIRIVKQEPVLINYTFDQKRYEKEPDAADLDILSRIEKLQFTDWFPSSPIPKGDKTQELIRHGISHTHHLYTRRNLIALSALRALVSNNRALQFWFSSTVPWCGRENRLHISNYFGKKGGQITSLRGTWYIPSLSVETNVFERFRLRINSALVKTGSIKNGCMVGTSSATDLRGIPQNTIDYVFIDPPFGYNLMYSELNCIWEAWLKVSTKKESEAIINKTQKKDLFAYQELMTRSFQEGYRVLKPGRWITIEFHNSKNSVWNAIQEALQKAGFVVADIRTLDKQKGSFNQVTASGSVKQDLIISAYKSNSGFEDRFKLSAGTEDGVWDFVGSHLKQLPVKVTQSDRLDVVTERMDFLLFDRMVAFHVQRGISVPMSASEFYAGLRERYPERDGMFFLPEQVAEYDKARMKAAEVGQLALFVTDEKSAIQWLRNRLEKSPATYQELHPEFLQELHQVKHEKMPELMTILEQNFLKDDQDRWYMPDIARAEDLEKIRERHLLREFWTYLPKDYKPQPESMQLSLLGNGERPTAGLSSKKIKIVRTEAVRVGFKTCWAERDYRTIIVVAERLPKNIIQEDPDLLMYYDNALMRAGD